MKKIAAKTGTYQKDGETKNRYTDIGVIMSNDNGEYVILNPSVSLAGVLAQQNALAAAEGKQGRSSVMASVFDNNQQQQAPRQQQAPQQRTPANQQAGREFEDFDDDMPF